MKMKIKDNDRLSGLQTSNLEIYEKQVKLNDRYILYLIEKPNKHG